MQTTSPEITKVLGERFTLLQLLGEGAMGEVYLVHDKYQDCKVALKIAKLTDADSKIELSIKNDKLWFNEMRLAGKLNHPYIVAIHEASTAGKRGYLIMEYVCAGTLKSHTSPGTLLGMQRVADITFKVSHALDYAHSQGLLHRDVKPANILLTQDGTPKVSDFGSCYQLDKESTQVLEVGTLPFMPPEQFAGAEPNVQTDIYALGVTAYQLLTGAYPFSGENQASIIYQKTFEEPVPISSRRAEVPAALCTVVHRAIHKDPAQRYRRWEEFREGLSLAFPEIETTQQRPSDSARFGRYAGLSFFEGFSETELWETVGLGQPHLFPTGHVIFSEGENEATVYVLQEGELDVSSHGIQINRILPGEGFGELAFIEGSGHCRTATVRAASNAVVIAFPANGLRLASGRLQAAFGKSFVRSLTSRLRQADKRYLASVRSS